MVLVLLRTLGCIYRWFPRARETFCGCVLALSGISGILFVEVLLYISIIVPSSGVLHTAFGNTALKRCVLSQPIARNSLG